MKRLTLRPGQEIIVNGYHVRAVGNPVSLQIYRPNPDFGRTWKLLYGGLAGDVVCSESINVGLADVLADLPDGQGWPNAKQTARTAIASRKWEE